MIIFGLSITVTLFLFSNVMLDNARESTSHLANGTISKIDGKLEKVEAIATSVMELYFMNELDSSSLDYYFHDLLYEHQELVSIGIAFDPSQNNIPNSKTITHVKNQAVIHYSSG
jgi:hypothetical protein